MNLKQLREINLTKGFSAFIDEDSYIECSKYKWFYHNGYALTCIFLHTYYDDRDKKGRLRPRHRKMYLHNFLCGLDELSPTDWKREKKVNYSVDHLNRNTLDNTIANLSYDTNRLNMINRGKHVLTKKEVSSKYKWVSWHTRDLVWRVTVDNIYFCCFKIEEEAAMSGDTIARLRFGNAITSYNFPDKNLGLDGFGLTEKQTKRILGLL